jgi:hypothetical protein
VWTASNGDKHTAIAPFCQTPDRREKGQGAPTQLPSYSIWSIIVSAGPTASPSLSLCSGQAEWRSAKDAKNS